ncbi:unnamed protein product [Blepharisma stoltei]|uniref:Uncharacterized protein n=1 Tax=Blepharisma stoltei TaxID=1481888 RepID=A0AAU9JLA1_9CILI|nr:unnamed protein product [Blepharisma stoltei]
MHNWSAHILQDGALTQFKVQELLQDLQLLSKYSDSLQGAIQFLSSPDIQKMLPKSAPVPSICPTYSLKLKIKPVKPKFVPFPINKWLDLSLNKYCE